jgi:hypothetical protein
MRLKIWVASVAVGIAATSVAALQLKTPADWKWRIDGPGSVTEAPTPKGDEMTFVAMPPGWHITTGPGALLYHPDYIGKGNFSVEAEVFLFPGDSQEEYGVFLGGKNLGPAETPSYLAFVARRDGRGAILRRGGPPVVDWAATDAILSNPGKDAVKNVLRVDANATDVVFSANGKEVARTPRASLNLEGQFGFRVGKGMNLHASRLDVTYKLAPAPVKKTTRP